MQEPPIAAALRYDPVEGSAPRLLAKGSGPVAEEILRIARENDVPLRSDPALAGALATLDIGAQIPSELFRTVAEVLAFVYGLERKG